jgi:hypothetical protein
MSTASLKPSSIPVKWTQNFERGKIKKEIPEIDLKKKFELESLN